jgi:regulator of protease activity HflC (stomatin/prohibitin superfamily)
MLTILIPLALIVIFLASFIKIVPEGYRGLVVRLGRYSRTLKPGINLLLPFIESQQLVDIREQLVDIPAQEAITQDNVSCMVDGVVRYLVVNPSAAIFKVKNYERQIAAMSQTALRDVIGSVSLDDLLSQRTSIAERIKTFVDENAESWGIDIKAVEIQNIEIPADMKRAMAQQAQAERDRKARIIKAQGEKEAAARLSEAAAMLSKSQGALALRTLQTIKEISADPSEKIVMAVPGDFFNLKNIIGHERS